MNRMLAPELSTCVELTAYLGMNLEALSHAGHTSDSVTGDAPVLQRSD